MSLHALLRALALRAAPNLDCQRPPLWAGPCNGMRMSRLDLSPVGTRRKSAVGYRIPTEPGPVERPALLSEAGDHSSPKKCLPFGSSR